MALNLEYVKGSGVRNLSNNKHQRYGAAYRCCDIIKHDKNKGECKMVLDGRYYSKEVEYSRKLTKVLNIAQKELPIDLYTKLFTGSEVTVDFTCFEKDRIVLMVVYCDDQDEQDLIKINGLDSAKKYLTPIIKDVFGDKYRVMATFASNRYRIWFPKYYLINKSGHKELAVSINGRSFRYYRGKWHRVKDRDYINNYLFGIDPTLPDSIDNLGNRDIQAMITSVTKKEAEEFLDKEIEENWFFDEIMKL